MKEEKTTKDIRTNTIGKKYDIGKLKKELEEFSNWVTGNLLGARPFMNVVYDFLDDFLKTLDGKIPFYYYDSCGWIKDCRNEREWFSTFFRFYLGATQWKEQMEGDYPGKFKWYKKNLTSEEVFGYIPIVFPTKKEEKEFRKRMKRI